MEQRGQVTLIRRAPRVPLPCDVPPNSPQSQTSGHVCSQVCGDAAGGEAIRGVALEPFAVGAKVASDRVRVLEMAQRPISAGRLARVPRTDGRNDPATRHVPPSGGSLFYVGSSPRVVG